MSELSIIPPSEPSAAQLLAAVVHGGVTSENVGAVRELVQMQRELRAEEAKREFAAALAELQAETGTIQAMTSVTNKHGALLYRYAKFEHLMAKIQPLLAKHGFSHSFDTIAGEGTITAIFELTHKGGHSKRNQYQSRVSRGLLTNEAQDDMGAKSYAKRGALCDGLGIVISSDDDARNQGAPITAEQAVELRRRVEITKANVEKFLKAACAATFESIPASKYDEMSAVLTRREAQQKSQQTIPEGEAWK